MPPGWWSGINDSIQVRQFINGASIKQDLQRVSCVHVGAKEDGG
jgi:hypothetical protein